MYDIEQKKTILLDPIKALTSNIINSTEAEIEEIQRLSDQLNIQNNQHKEEQIRSKRISREIGEAKRRGDSIDSLKSTMQRQSLHVNQIKEQIRDTEHRILEQFDLNSLKKEKVSDEIPLERDYLSPTIDINKITVTLLKDEADAWNEYVDKTQAASFYHRVEWKDLILQTFGHEGIYCFAQDEDGGVVGILPLIHLKSRLFGNFLASMPYFNFGGAIADHPVIEQELMAFANEKAAQLGVSHVEYRDDIERGNLPVRSEKANMMLQLPDTHESLWNSFPAKLRSQIKRPYRENPEVAIGGKEHLDNFYAVFAHNMRDLGTPVYAKKFFLAIMETFPKESRIIIVKLKGIPVAAGFLINHGQMLEIPWASTVRSVNHLSMNMLMYWEVMKFATNEGLNWFDFGRSTVGGGTYRFKRQWGAKPKHLHWHYWLETDEDLPSLNPSNPKYALLINIWKKMPVSLTKIVGPAIVKNLP